MGFNSNVRSPKSRPAGVGRAILGALVMAILTWAALFGAAGRLDWPMGWAFFVVMVASTLLGRLLVARSHPDLIAERGGFAEKQDAKSWDSLLMPAVAIVGPLATWIVAGLDARFGWTASPPLAWQIAGLVLLLLASLLGTWAMLANRFFAAVVRIQRERGHTVQSGGPYRYVRHPGYAAGILGLLAAPLALGSWWALLPAGLTTLLFVARTALEDGTLQAELPGYREYAQRVRYRLLPGVW